MQMEIVNLTPHAVKVITDDKTTSYPASGNVARLNSVEQKVCPELTAKLGVPVSTAPEFTEAIGLPADTNTNIIVSMAVAQYLKQNKSWSGIVFSPDTGPGQAIRNEEGDIVGVRRLAVW